MRQVGSLMGIAILGAVLQNRVTANITEGVQAISQIPEAAKQKIIAAAGSGSMQMGMPSGGSSMPAMAKAMMETLFKGWFTDAIASAFIVAVILAVIGGLCALLLRSHVKDAEAVESEASAAPARRRRGGRRRDGRGRGRRTLSGAATAGRGEPRPAVASLDNAHAPLSTLGQGEEPFNGE